MKDIKDEIQQKAVQAFLSVKSRRGTILMGTGLGKSKVAIDIIKKLTIPEQGKTNSIALDILLLVNSERLRDNDWKENCEKFSFDWGCITPDCYQTAYKWSGKHYDIVIADEFDFSLTPEYSKFYLNNTYDVLIALTAHIPEDKRELANSIAPICFEKSTQEAQNEGLLNKTKFIQVNFDLGQTKDLKLPMKNGGFFFQSENGNYLYLEENIQSAIIAQSVANANINKNSLLGIDTTEWEKKRDRAGYQITMFTRKRKDFLHKLISSRKVVNSLIREITTNNPLNKILVFSKLTEQSAAMCEHTFNSKNKKNNTNIEKLDSGEIRVLGICEALNRGANLKGVSHIIKESYVGSDTDFQQQHGRGVRLGTEDVMAFIILVPHFWIKVAVTDENKNLIKYQWVRQPTQAIKWMQNMTDGFDLSDKTIIEADKDYNVHL